MNSTQIDTLARELTSFLQRVQAQDARMMIEGAITPFDRMVIEHAVPSPDADFDMHFSVHVKLIPHLRPVIERRTVAPTYTLAFDPMTMYYGDPTPVKYAEEWARRKMRQEAERVEGLIAELVAKGVSLADIRVVSKRDGGTLSTLVMTKDEYEKLVGPIPAQTDDASHGAS